MINVIRNLRLPKNAWPMRRRDRRFLIFTLVFGLLVSLAVAGMLYALYTKSRV